MDNGAAISQVIARGNTALAFNPVFALVDGKKNPRPDGRQFEGCCIHRESQVPCKPSKGWLTSEIRPCSRRFLHRGSDYEEGQRSACLDVTMARFLECVMEDRPNHALRVLNEGIRRFIQKWDVDEEGTVDDQCRTVIEDCLKLGCFVGGIEIPPGLHKFILSKPMATRCAHDELPPDQPGSWLVQTAEVDRSMLGKALMGRICRYWREAWYWETVLENYSDVFPE